jgi:hypothetical protein
MSAIVPSRAAVREADSSRREKRRGTYQLPLSDANAALLRRERCRNDLHDPYDKSAGSPHRRHNCGAKQTIDPRSEAVGLVWPCRAGSGSGFSSRVSKVE